MEKTILVTGASRGIGKAIATVLAGAGYGVVVHYHQNVAMAEALVQQFRAAGGNARCRGSRAMQAGVGSRCAGTRCLLRRGV